MSAKAFITGVLHNFMSALRPKGEAVFTACSVDSIFPSAAHPQAVSKKGTKSRFYKKTSAG